MTTGPIIRAGASLDGITRRVSRVNQLPIFYEDWKSGFVDASKWKVSVSGSGDVAQNENSGAIKGLFSDCRLLTGATNASVASIASRKLLFSPQYGQTALTSFVERCVIEFQLIVTLSLATIDNTTFFFGVSTQQNAVRVSNSSIGFGLTSDVLEGYTIRSGTAATKTFTDAITTTGLHKYKIEVDRLNGIRWFVDDVQEAAHTTAASIPNDQGSMYINMYLKNDSAADSRIEVGEVRVWLEDIIQ